jgi:predicted nucleotidyltransferase
MGYLAASLGSDQPTAEEVATLVDGLKQAILARCRPLAICLFGSAADGTLTRASDLDVAVILPNGHDVRAAKADLFRGPPLVLVPYDLLVFEQSEFERKAVEGGICQVIKDTGKSIYDERPKV